MFVVLDGGIALPVPRSVGTDPFKREQGLSDYRWKQTKQERWLRAYTHCLYSLHSQFDEPLHKAINHIAARMLDVEDTYIVALRFVGEMHLSGYIELPEQKQKGSRDKTERIIVPTDKLLGVDLGTMQAPNTAVKMPAVCGKDYLSKSIKIHHGVSSKQNKEVASIVNSMSNERFTINEFVYQLMREFRPGTNKTKFKSEYMLGRCLTSAEQLRGQSFRFGLFLDSRSRMYTDTTCAVSYQGSDWERALCQPCYAEPLTPKGVQALILAAWSYSEVQWDMVQMIRHARNPREFYLEWSTADQPYSYMACANLLSMYEMAPETPLPAFAPLDGRCSGLQHWSAVSRSRAITAHLGMEEDEHPLDIYEKIAEDWSGTLPEWQRKFATRKGVKIPVMTWGYNATRMTSMEWLDSLFGQKKKWSKEEKAFVVVEDGIERALAGKLGCELYDQINVTLADLTACVNWVSDCATSIAKAGNCDIHWPTPDGFECKQRKLVGVPRQLSLVLSDGSTFAVGILDYSGQIPAHGKHRSAIAPNVIHSLDATHLRMVARMLAKLGLPMIFIHDSFSTHVNHRDTLYRIIVETFAELYSCDWLSTLREYWMERYGLDLPQPPPLGDWDPNSVKFLSNFFI